MGAKLLLMRHGQSIWNKQNLFTGWVDIPLSAEGIQESIAGGIQIQNAPIDVAFTSTLIRAQMTLTLALLHHKSGKIPVFEHPDKKQIQEWAQIYSAETNKGIIPVHIAWELNERMYGKLQGLNKEETAQRFGREQVQLWRRSYDVAPPEGESLAQTVARAVPYFEKTVVPCLAAGKNVFIAAHGNSLRGIIMHLENLSKEEVVHLELPTGTHVSYTYDRGKWTQNV